MIATPGVAYLVRTEKASAGVMISASHNPALDNGIKFFGGDGFKLADEQELLDNGTETIIGEDVDATYLANAKSVTVNPDLAKEYGKDMKFVFTPLCGTGRMLGERALRQAGFTNFTIEPTEAQPNGDFLAWNTLTQNFQRHLFVPLS